MQIVELGSEWDEALIVKERSINENGITPSLYLASIYPRNNPQVVLQGFIETADHGKPSIHIPESSPTMRLLNGEINKVTASLRNPGSEIWGIMYDLAPLMARHNLLSLGTDLNKPDFEKLGQVLGTDRDQRPKGFDMTFSFGRNIHDLSEPISGSSHIRGMREKWTDFFTDISDIFKMRDFIDVYSERINSRLGILTIAPLNYEQWRQRSFSYLESVRHSVIVDGSVVQPQNSSTLLAVR